MRRPRVSPTVARVPPGEQPLPGLGDGVRELQAGEPLFRRGEARTHLFLVEAGTIGVYSNLCGGQAVELAVAGDIVGHGWLPRHVFSATAASQSRVRLLALNAGDDVRHRSERTQRRYADAVKGEFIARRDELREMFRDYPLRRVAAFLLAMSELNAHEGRDPDSLCSETVASCLDLDLDTLGGILVELQQMQLVAPCPPSGLRLTNLAGLYALASDTPAIRAW
jgi:CRP/FNR family transcriptional regulator, anaerobic regulatory protein